MKVEEQIVHRPRVGSPIAQQLRRAGCTGACHCRFSGGVFLLPCRLPCVTPTAIRDLSTRDSRCSDSVIRQLALLRMRDGRESTYPPRGSRPATGKAQDRHCLRELGGMLIQCRYARGADCALHPADSHHPGLPGAPRYTPYVLCTVINALVYTIYV